jgi:dihydrolipoamide dehydrogenase
VLLPTGLADGVGEGDKEREGDGDGVGLAPLAGAHSEQAVEGMFTGHKPRRIRVFPGCTYCQPQVASVGLTERAATEKRLKFKVGKFPFSANGKALTSMAQILSYYAAANT